MPTTPFNYISTNNAESICENTCKFMYKYNVIDFNIQQYKNCIFLLPKETSGKKTQSHINKKKINVSGIYILNKSKKKHTYYDATIDEDEIVGEIIIEHNNGEMNVVIPILNSSSSSLSATDKKFNEFQMIVQSVKDKKKSVPININYLMTADPFIYYQNNKTVSKWFVYDPYPGALHYNGNSIPFETKADSYNTKYEKILTRLETNSKSRSEYSTNLVGFLPLDTLTGYNTIDCVPISDNDGDNDDNNDNNDNVNNNDDVEEIDYKYYRHVAITILSVFGCIVFIVFGYELYTAPNSNSFYKNESLLNRFLKILNDLKFTTFTTPTEGLPSSSSSSSSSTLPMSTSSSDTTSLPRWSRYKNKHV